MVIRVSTIEDPRLGEYREIRDKPLVDRGLFLAEGEHVVMRLLRAAGAGEVRVRSVLLAEKRVGEVLPFVPAGVPVFVLSGEEVSRLLGFAFHSGMIACGVVPATARLEHVVPRTGRARVVVLPEIGSAENLGTLIRLSAGMGADAVVLGERCTDPFLRRTVRVSMGTVFGVPLVRSGDIVRDLVRMRTEMGIETVATVLHPGAEVLGSLATPDRVAVAFGSEAQGLTQAEVAACGRSVTIPMTAGVDSLNVGVAAGIAMWELFGRGRAGLLLGPANSKN